MQRTIFTEEHLMFRDSVRHFVEKEIVPYYDQWEKDGIVSRDVWLKAGQQGFLGFNVPEQYRRRGYRRLLLQRHLRGGNVACRGSQRRFGHGPA